MDQVHNGEGFLTEFNVHVTFTKFTIHIYLTFIIYDKIGACKKDSIKSVLGYLEWNEREDVGLWGIGFLIMWAKYGHYFKMSLPLLLIMMKIKHDILI